VAIPPVLLLAFNRADRLEQLLKSLKKLKPEVVRVSIDGPRSGADVEGVKACEQLASEVDWVPNYDVWTRDKNAGIAQGIPLSVTRFLAEFPEVFVIEDDVTLGPDALTFVGRALDLWRDHPTVHSISAYNMVPLSEVTDPSKPVRLSRVSSSYAWATWNHKWQCFDHEMASFRRQGIRSQKDLLGSYLSAIRWRQHVRYARLGLVDCASYLWNTSTWQNDGLAVVPNVNLVEYRGIQDGTHTRRKRRWDELPIGSIDLPNLESCVSNETVDLRADLFFHARVQRASWANILLGPLEEVALRLQRRGWI
jgi:hypothetical protein